MRRILCTRSAALLAAATGAVVLVYSLCVFGLPPNYLHQFGLLALTCIFLARCAVHTSRRDICHTQTRVPIFASLILIPISWTLLLCVLMCATGGYVKNHDARHRRWLVLYFTALNMVLVFGAYCVLSHTDSLLPSTFRQWAWFSGTVVAFEGIHFGSQSVLLGGITGRAWKDVIFGTSPDALSVLMLPPFTGMLLARFWQSGWQAAAITICLCLLTQRALILTQRAQDSILDAKTGLYDYRYFQQRLKRFLDVRLSNQPVSLLFCDLDNLRHINSTYGHQAGDLAIIQMATILRSLGRPRSLASRFGGEEFAVVMPRVAKREAARLAEHARAELEASINTLPTGETFRVTVSCGIATCPDDACSMDELLRVADAQMYRAKAEGRNKVVFAGDTRLAKEYNSLSKNVRSAQHAHGYARKGGSTQ